MNNLPKQVAQALFDAIEKGTLDAYRIIWSVIKNFAFEHWIGILLTIFCLYVIAIIKFLVTGRWGMLASLTYRFLYLSGLFVIALIFGSDIFANQWFDIVLVFLYVACFEAVGHLLRKSGIKK